MKKSLFFVFMAVFALIFAASAADLPVGKVDVEDFLNVRRGPGIKHPVTGRLKPAQEVQIIRICGSWLEIKAPETLPVYLSEARVGANGKLSGELNMRCRMDVNSPSYGLLPAGTVVKRLDERANGWVRIVPPENLKVYVAAVLVRFDRNAFAADGTPVSTVKAVEKPAPAAVDTPAATDTTDPAVQQLSGILIKWKFAKTPEMSYALLDKPDGKNQAFIIMDNMSSLAAFDNKPVNVQGIFVKEENGIKFFKASAITDAVIPAPDAAATPAEKTLPAVKNTPAPAVPALPPAPAPDPKN